MLPGFTTSTHNTNALPFPSAPAAAIRCCKTTLVFTRNSDPPEINLPCTSALASSEVLQSQAINTSPPMSAKVIFFCTSFTYLFCLRAAPSGNPSRLNTRKWTSHILAMTTSSICDHATTNPPSVVATNRGREQSACTPSKRNSFPRTFPCRPINRPITCPLIRGVPACVLPFADSLTHAMIKRPSANAAHAGCDWFHLMP